MFQLNLIFCLFFCFFFRNKVYLAAYPSTTYLRVNGSVLTINELKNEVSPSDGAKMGMTTCCSAKTGDVRGANTATSNLQGIKANS